VNPEVNVAVRPTADARPALTGDANARTVGNAGRDLYFE